MEIPLPRSQTLLAKERGGFSLIELLVAVTIFVAMLAIVLSVIGQTTSIWKGSSNKIEAFQSARAGFDQVTRSISQATLNTYLDYNDVNDPKEYLRQSELKFLIGQSGASGMPGLADTGQCIFFQAPLTYTLNNGSYGGLDSLLNICGYYISFTTNTGVPSHVPASKNPYRYRLMQLLVPVEKNTVYDASGAGKQWFTAQTNYVTAVADNIIALIVRPQDPSAATPDISTNAFSYDSTLNATNHPQPQTANQLPPVVQVTMVAIDEASAARLEQGSAAPGVIASALSGKFINPARYDIDVAELESSLLKAGIDCRVFAGAVPIRESKWTK